MTNESLKREEFIRRKKDARSEVDMIAQQLTNIYRQLSILGEEAGEKFNQQLLRQVNPEVLASLKTIPGGEEVREYYNFLTHTETDESDSPFGKSSEDIIDGMLPKAEQLSPVWETFGIASVPGAPGGGQKPIQMSVVNPIRASVITSPANAPDHMPLGPLSAAPQQSKVDFEALQKDIDESYEKQKTDIMQALNFIVIDSNIEKMHQNLKVAINVVTEKLDLLKDDLKKIVTDVSEKAAFPEFSDSQENEQKTDAEQESEKVTTEKTRKTKTGQKFSVDMTDNED